MAHSPLLYQYLRKFQEDPTSRIFAPLAELYRKAGLIDEAIEIAKEGLRIHPNFTGGRVALARALFDKQLYDDVVRELTHVIRDSPDNLVAQRLFAESSLMLGRVSDALGGYKMLLYFSPSDGEAARLVQELESQAYEKGTLLLTQDTPEHFNVQTAQDAIESDPEFRHNRWVKQVEILQNMLLRIERYKVRERSKTLESKGLANP